jgi:hypothetical protein
MAWLGLSLAQVLDPATAVDRAADLRGASAALPTSSGSTGPPSARTEGRAATGQEAPALATFQPLSIALPGGPPARVIGVGVHSDGSLVIPDDPQVIGWWTGGAQAGDPFGSVVLAGHVDSRKFGVGALFRLSSLRSGQMITLVNGKLVMKYRVVSKHEVAQADLTSGTDAFSQQVPGRLVVITCGGPYDAVTHHYRDNIIVTATPVRVGADDS